MYPVTVRVGTWLNWSICGSPASEPSNGKTMSAPSANRLAHGQPKRGRKLEAAQQAKASRDLDLHRIDSGGKQ